jgi:hypothetical protein
MSALASKAKLRLRSSADERRLAALEKDAFRAVQLPAAYEEGAAIRRLNDPYDLSGSPHPRIGRAPARRRIGEHQNRLSQIDGSVDERIRGTTSPGWPEPIEPALAKIAGRGARRARRIGRNDGHAELP